MKSLRRFPEAGDCMTDRVVCNNCEQDWLRLYRIRGVEVKFYLCLECESVWPTSADLSVPTEHYLSEFLESFGLVGGFADIEAMESV
jgi:hypothetical protein